MMTFEDTVSLIEELNNAAAVYYQDLDEELMTDAEYDIKLELLSTLVDFYPDLFEDGSDGFKLLDTVVAAGTDVVKSGQRDTVKHDNPMMSLAKAKNEKELKAWVARVSAAGVEDYVLQCKLDGLAVSIKYVDGVATQAATRGDGETGEDISYIFNTHNLFVVGLPEKYGDKTLEVRGELFLSNIQFAELDYSRAIAFPKLEKFKNSRNAMVGTLKKAKLGLEYRAKFTFGSYSVWQDGKLLDLDSLDDGGFITVNSLTEECVGDLKLTGFGSFAELFDSIHKFGELRKDFNIPTDGVVIKPVNESVMYSKMGVNAHHPLSQIAYKYPGEKAISEVLAIDVTVGKTGKLTPIARIKPVDLEGTTISNVSLHNFNLLYDLGVKTGSTVTVIRANDVIPQLANVISSPSDSKIIEVPTKCPICSEDLFSDDPDDLWPPRTLRCLNDLCPSREYYGIKTAVGKNFLDIDGLSEVMLTELYESGRIKDISDLYTLTVEELADTYAGSDGEKRRFGEKRAQHVVNFIEASKTKPLYRLLASLNITGLGPSMAKKLIEAFGSLDNILAATVQEISNVEGFAVKRAKEISNGLVKRLPLIEALKERGVVFEVEETDSSEDNPISGKSFAISGPVPEPFANRNKWVEYVESKGGVFHSSPKDNTDYMVADKNGSSSKVKSAISKGLTFITAEDFTADFVE